MPTSQGCWEHHMKLRPWKHFINSKVSYFIEGDIPTCVTELFWSVLCVLSMDQTLENNILISVDETWTDM